MDTKVINKWVIPVLLALAITLCFFQQVRINLLSQLVEASDRQIDELRADLRDRPDPSIQLADNGELVLADHPSIEDEIDAAMNAVAPDGVEVYGSPVQDLRKEYATEYRKAREQKLRIIDHCEACGVTGKQLARRGEHLETHHCKSVEVIFTEHLDHKLIYDPANLIVLCRKNGTGCHFLYGHLGKSWAVSNPNVRRDAAKHLVEVKSKTTLSP